MSSENELLAPGLQLYGGTSTALGKGPQTNEPPMLVIRNLDGFLARLYGYCQEQGARALLLHSLRRIVCGCFSVVLFAIVTLRIDWNAVIACSASSDCTTTSIWNAQWVAEWTSWASFAVVCTLVFAVYWVWTVLTVVQQLSTVYKMQQFAEQTLNISEEQLQIIGWSDVVERLMQRQSTGQLAMIRKPMSHLTVANRIMRVENFFIALVAQDVLGLVSSGREWLFSTALCWNLQQCVLRPLFTSDWQLDRSFLDNPLALRRRFRVMALANLLFTPFTLLYTCATLFWRHVEEIYSQRDLRRLSERSWTLFAKWSLREWNELPHLLSQRLERAAQFAQPFLDQYPNAQVTQVAQLVVYPLGALTSMLITLMLLDSALLLRLTAGGIPLLSYFTLFLLLIAMARAYIPQKSQRFSPGQLCAKTCRYAHLPFDGSAQQQSIATLYTNVQRTKRRVQSLFRHKLWILVVQELFGIVATPFLLWFYLPQRSHQILECLQACVTQTDDIGVVCRSALFRAGDDDDQGDKLHRSRVYFMASNHTDDKKNNNDVDAPVSGSSALMNRRVPSFDSLNSLSSSSSSSSPEKELEHKEDQEHRRQTSIVRPSAEQHLPTDKNSMPDDAVRITVDSCDAVLLQSLFYGGATQSMPAPGSL